MEFLFFLSKSSVCKDVLYPPWLIYPETRLRVRQVGAGLQFLTCKEGSIWVLVAERAPSESITREAETVIGEKMFLLGVFSTSFQYSRKAKLVLLEDI